MKAQEVVGQEVVGEEVSHASATPTESEPESSQRDEVQIPDRRTAVALARQQPKSPKKEKRLRERYFGMPLVERAFAIFFDLGKNSNPTNPNYDHFNDDELCL